MAQKFVGIDLGTHHIKVAVVSAGIRGVQLVDTFAEPVGPLPPTVEGEEPPDPFDHQLRGLFASLRARGLLGETASVCLPSGDVSYRLLSFPFDDERRIAQTVGFEAEGQFPRPIEDLVYGHVVVPSTEGGGRALVAAAPKDRVNKMHAVFQRTASEIKAVTTSGIALAAVGKVSLPVATPQMAEDGRAPCVLYVDLGHKHTQFVAMGAKGPLAIRSTRRGGRQLTAAIARAFSMDTSSAEAAKHTDAFLPHRGMAGLSEAQMQSGTIVAKAFEPILRELEHTRIWLRSTYHLEVSQVVLLGGGANLSGVREYVTEQTGLAVTDFKPNASGLKTGTVSGADLGEFAAALGAAYGAARRPLLQLRDAEGGVVEGGWVQEKMTGLVAIGVAVMAFGALDTIARVKAADAQLLAYEDELATATEAAFGEAVGVSDVKAVLDGAEGADLTSLVPERGALETLALIVDAATPSDIADKPPPAPVPPPGTDPGLLPAGFGAPGTPAVGPDGLPLLGPDGLPLDPALAEPKPIGPIPADAGIVLVDELTLSLVDIRQLKVEIKAGANTSSAQDRLAAKLAGLGCISNVSKGKVRGEERKTFQMEMDNKCFFKKAAEDDEAELEEETAEPEGADGSVDEPAEEKDE
ncbi:MAG: pilus assembly protein PilM [Nannocystales bacterium]